MKYIVIGFEGFIFSIASHLQKEGHQVLAGVIHDGKKVFPTSDYRENKENTKLRLSVYDNIVEKLPIDVLLKKLEKISDPQKYFVICESNAIYYYASYLQKLGFEGTFPTKENRLFEIDRNLSKKFVKKNYPLLKVAENLTFHKVKDAISFLKSSKKTWVLKSQTDDIATVVPMLNTPKDANKQLIEELSVHKSMYEEYGFLIEQKISKVIEVTPEKIYYDGVPLGMTIMFENKYIGSGNISYQVGCAGDIVFPVSMESRIHEICFPPIVDKLAKEHKGLFIWDASLLIDEETGEIFFGEFCPNRFGFNSFLTTLEQMPTVNSYFESVLKKKNPFSIGTVGVSVTMYNLLQDPKNEKILRDITVEFSDEDTRHIWPYDLYKKEKEGPYYTCGTDTSVTPITGASNSLYTAVDQLYETVENFQMSQVYYRPKFDFLSHDYSTSICNRLEYCVDQKLFSLPFSL